MSQLSLGISNVADLAMQTSNALSWLNSLGVRTAGTRLTRYGSAMNAYATAVESGADDVRVLVEETWGLDLTYDYLSESYDLVNIHNGLKDSEGQRLTESLRDYSGGPVSSRKEEPSRGKNNRPRNIGFELSLAASFRRCGFTLDWALPSDVGLEIAGSPILVECKRPSHTGKVKSRLSEAQKQLSSGYQEVSGDRVRGFAAIAVGKFLCDAEHKQLHVPTTEALGSALGYELEKFSQENEDCWTAPIDDRTIGTIVSFRCVANVSGVPTPCTQWAIIPQGKIGVISTAIFFEIDRIMLGGRTYSLLDQGGDTGLVLLP